MSLDLQEILTEGNHLISTNCFRKQAINGADFSHWKYAINRIIGSKVIYWFVD